MIEARTPDGAVHQFPDGTPDAIIDDVIKTHLATPATGVGEHGYAAAPPEEPKPAPINYSQQPSDPATLAVNPPPGALGNIVRAVVEGAQQPPAYLTPEAKAAAEAGNQQTWVGRNLVSPLVSLSEVPFRGLNALGGGIGQATYEVGNALGGPALGRDLYMGSQVVPEAMRVNPPPSLVRLQPRPELPDWLRREPEAPPGPAQTAEVYPPGAAPPEPEPVTPPPAAPQPAAAGAQVTPGAELGMTPKEEAAYRSTAEGNKLLEPQEPGVRDTTQYIPGERINQAESSQDVQIARELKSLRQQTPNLDATLTADETHNSNLRTNAIHNALPGQVQITAAKAARQDAMATAEPKVFAKATAADVQPVVQTIQDVLSDPKNRQNTQLQQYVRPLMDRLQNADGTPKITDARELWGFRQDVQHLTSSAAQRSDPNLSRVSGILGGVLDAIDNQIEAAAPGYKAKLRDDYRTRSQQIDAMEALNEQRFKLFDSQNKPNYNAVQSLMRRIVDARQANDPYDAFTHVTPETLDQLFNIRDSMRRSVAADRLAAPKGSPTSQNLGDAMRAAGRMAAQTAAPAIGATLGSAFIPIPGVGPAIGLGVGSAVNHLFSERALAQRYARGMELRNPLAPPP